MSKVVFNIVYSFADVFLLILLIFSFFVHNKSHSIKHFLIFHIYLILCSIDNLALEILRFYDYLGKVNWMIFELIFSFFHFGLFSLFLIKQLKRKAIYVFYLYVLILTFLTVVIFIDYKNSNYYSASISNIGLIIFCVIYYLDLLNGNLHVDLKSDPMFLITTGLFLGSGTLTPILLFGNHLRQILDNDTYYWVAILSPISSIVMYCIFLRSFLCIIKIKK
jgi:hypothetical protein